MPDENPDDGRVLMFIVGAIFCYAMGIVTGLMLAGAGVNAVLGL